MKFIDYLDSIATKIERIFSGNAPTDPLYISNRTIWQRIRQALTVGTTGLILAALVILALNGYFNSRVVDPASDAQRARADTANVLPDIEKSFVKDKNRDMEVVEATLSTNGDRTVSGKFRNNTDRLVRNAEVLLYVINAEGSQIGLVKVRVQNIAPRATAPFKAAVPQAAAQSVAVNEIRLQ